MLNGIHKLEPVVKEVLLRSHRMAQTPEEVEENFKAFIDTTEIPRLGAKPLERGMQSEQ
ncbi:MAG: hypothetical protein QXH93_04380 [Conexivisphaerales archaeon]